MSAKCNGSSACGRNRRRAIGSTTCTTCSMIGIGSDSPMITSPTMLAALRQAVTASPWRSLTSTWRETSTNWRKSSSRKRLNRILCDGCTFGNHRDGTALWGSHPSKIGLYTILLRLPTHSLHHRCHDRQPLEPHRAQEILLGYRRRYLIGL